MIVVNMRRAPTFSVLLLAAMTVLLGCRPRGASKPPGEGWAARAMVLEARLAEDPEDDRARRDLAYIRWLHLGQSKVGKGLLEQGADRGDLASRLGLVIMADARLDAAAVERHGYALIAEAARAPAGQRAFADAAAEYTARRIASAHGDRPGDDKRFRAMFDALHRELEAGRAQLSFSAQQPLLSLRAAIARRHGKDYAAWYRQEGCVQAWSAERVQGHLGALALDEVDVAQTVQPDPNAVVAQLACVVRVWNPTPSPGVRRLRSELDVKGTTLELDLGTEFPSKTFFDGHLVHRTDTTRRFAPNRVTLALTVEPGTHTVDVVTTIPSERAWVMMRATDGRGRPVAARKVPTLNAARGTAPKVARLTAPWPKAAGPLKGELYAPLRALLAVEDALAEGDSDRAERQLRVLAKAEHFAEAHRSRAAFERSDPSRGRTVSQSRERKALDKALAVDPTLDAARLRLLQMEVDRDENEALAMLEALPTERLRGLDGELLRYLILRQIGTEHRATQALDRAETVNPESCRVLLARRSIAREHDDVRSEDEIAERMKTCAGSLEIRARLAERRGDTAKAAALWEETLDRVPDDIEALEALARLSALAGDHEAAKKRLDRILRLNPFRVGSHIALADLAASRGEPDRAREHLSNALRQIPHSNVLHRAAATLGIPDDLEQWRTDGEAALADYRSSGETYEGVAEVLVLDRSVVRVYDNGGQRQIVHIIAHLLNKEALDRYGEIQIPDGAQLLALHTIKPDGTRLEPEVIGGKEGLSLRHLEVGDAVEYEFVVEQSPVGPMPGYIDVSTFRFQSPDVPYHRTELEVIHPTGMDIRSDSRNGPPRQAVTMKGGLTSRLWRTTKVARLGVEPGQRDWLDELPNVHVYTLPVLEDYLGSLVVQIRESQRTNPALRSLVRKLTRGADNDADKLDKLWSWVVENIEDAGDLTGPVTLAHAGRRGNRMALLKAMLREAGIDAELWLARDRFGSLPIDGGNPMLQRYEAPMLAVRLSGAKDRMMVLTASKVMPPGYLPPGLRGTEALRLQLDHNEAASGRVKVPSLRADVDSKAWDLEVEVDRDGGGTVSGTIELTGLEAVMWRQALRDVDRDRIEEVFQRAELAWLRGATLSELSIEGERDLQKPLTLRFSADARGIGIAEGGGVVMRAAPMPLNPSANFAGLPRRTTGLVVPYAPVYRAHLSYHFAGGSFVDVPDAASISSQFGRFERSVSGGGKGTDELQLEVESQLVPGVVEPGEYSKLADFAQAVEGEAQAVLRAR